MTDSQPARGCDLNALTITNLRNRMEASAKAASYHQRGFVDVPIQELERLLDMVQPAVVGSVVTDEVKSLRLAMEEYGSDAWATISDGDRCRAPGNHAEAIRQLLEPVAGGGVELTDDVVARAATVHYRTLCECGTASKAMRAALVAALQVQAMRAGVVGAGRGGA